jgi:hypothetical protein
MKLQVAIPQSFEAVQSTVVRPIGKAYGEVITVEPIAYFTVGAGLPVVAAVNATLLEH